MQNSNWTLLRGCKTALSLKSHPGYCIVQPQCSDWAISATLVIYVVRNMTGSLSDIKQDAIADTQKPKHRKAKIIRTEWVRGESDMTSAALCTHVDKASRDLFLEYCNKGKQRDFQFSVAPSREYLPHNLCRESVCLSVSRLSHNVYCSVRHCRSL